MCLLDNRSLVPSLDPPIFSLPYKRACDTCPVLHTYLVDTTTNAVIFPKSPQHFPLWVRHFTCYQGHHFHPLFKIFLIIQCINLLPETFKRSILFIVYSHFLWSSCVSKLNHVCFERKGANVWQRQHLRFTKSCNLDTSEDPFKFLLQGPFD